MAASCPPSQAKASAPRVAHLPKRHGNIPADVLSRCLWGLFPERSEWACACRAASWLGCSPETVVRMLRRETDARWSLAAPIVGAALAHGLVTTREVFG